jgi:hypothetical protein
MEVVWLLSALRNKIFNGSNSITPPADLLFFFIAAKSDI